MTGPLIRMHQIQAEDGSVWNLPMLSIHSGPLKPAAVTTFF
jgi:hypothetical protein